MGGKNVLLYKNDSFQLKIASEFPSCSNATFWMTTLFKSVDWKLNINCRASSYFTKFCFLVRKFLLFVAIILGQILCGGKKKPLKV